MSEELSLLQFPCEFPLKVMGLAQDNFDALVVGIVRRHVAHLGEGAVAVRASREGKYHCVTVTFTALSRDQLDGLYRELTSHPHILFVL